MSGDPPLHARALEAATSAAAAADRPPTDPVPPGDSNAPGSSVPASSDPESIDPAAVVAAPGPIEGRAASHRMLLLMLGLIGCWGLLMKRFGSAGNIYAVMGPFALSVVAVVVALASRKLAIWLRPSVRAVLSGLAVGVVMTLVTYPAYALLRSLLPEVEVYVDALYVDAHQTTLAEALPWVIAIIVAEELLWRGALLYVLQRRVPPALAGLISVASYAAAQFGTGSWIVMLLAVVCGTLWTLQRRFTHSLLAPLIAHLIWTPTVILFFPVTSM